MTRKEHTLTIDPDVMLKHWLLNLAVEFPVGLVELFPNYQWGRRNIKELPGFDKYDYVKGLLGLFDSGLIKLTSEVDGYDGESRDDLVRLLDGLLRLANDDLKDAHMARRERRLSPDLQVFYQLTAAGGEVWGHLAEPDWGHYMHASFLCSESGALRPGDVPSPNRDLIMAFIGWYHEIYGDFEGIPSEAITWQTHSDLEILYWKRLPSVHHASFRVKPIEADSRRKWPEHEWLKEWYDSAITWYKHPWELEGWPNEGND